MTIKTTVNGVFFCSVPRCVTYATNLYSGRTNNTSRKKTRTFITIATYARNVQFRWVGKDFIKTEIREFVKRVYQPIGLHPRHQVNLQSAKNFNILLNWFKSRGISLKNHVQSFGVLRVFLIFLLKCTRVFLVIFWFLSVLHPQVNVLSRLKQPFLLEKSTRLEPLKKDQRIFSPLFYFFIEIKRYP